MEINNTLALLNLSVHSSLNQSGVAPIHPDAF
jgi:hypothetical protein